MPWASPSHARELPLVGTDRVVLGPDRVADRSTYDDPWQLSVGIEHVLVAGEPVLSNGLPTELQPGRVLCKSGVRRRRFLFGSSVRPDWQCSS
jgi:hypothetical protein